uniref:Uncharacterized protein n=1 Tax=Zea mays TaxID=4577 RepID=C4J487_MAIZE|nr:unknown [Zea mays]ACR36821.1 unknown [Zea mays]
MAGSSTGSADGSAVGTSSPTAMAETTFGVLEFTPAKGTTRRDTQEAAVAGEDPSARSSSLGTPTMARTPEAASADSSRGSASYSRTRVMRCARRNDARSDGDSRFVTCVPIVTPTYGSPDPAADTSTADGQRREMRWSKRRKGKSSKQLPLTLPPPLLLPIGIW